MTSAPVVEELRLTAFKSFVAATLPLTELTLVIGRNGSGKSNAIDGLQVLARLAGGEDVADAIEGGRREGTEVRGGVRGSAPFGTRRFDLGCSVRVGEEVFGLDVGVQTDPETEVVHERLWLRHGRHAERELIVTQAPEPTGATIQARYDSGGMLHPAAEVFRASRLLTTQVAARVPSDCAVVHRAAEAVLGALQAIFVLDPVPSRMRQYVPERDSVLRRDAENLSAAVGALLKDPESEARLRELVQALPEQAVDRVTVGRSNLGDVILALEERRGRANVPVSARVMSDGMLRFLAFATALLENPRRRTDRTAGEGQELLVMEELENGLHPSQAARAVGLIKGQLAERQVRVLATTHSPAMLTALDPADHAGVIVCDRAPEDGASRLRRLVDLPSYPSAMASGSLGEAVVKRRLEDSDRGAGTDVLDSLLAGL